LPDSGERKRRERKDKTRKAKKEEKEEKEDEKEYGKKGGSDVEEKNVFGSEAASSKGNPYGKSDDLWFWANDSGFPERNLKKKKKRGWGFCFFGGNDSDGDDDDSDDDEKLLDCVVRGVFPDKLLVNEMPFYPLSDFYFWPKGADVTVKMKEDNKRISYDTYSALRKEKLRQKKELWNIRNTQSKVAFKKFACYKLVSFLFDLIFMFVEQSQIT
jgi:hypothetical protein